MSEKVFERLVRRWWRRTAPISALFVCTSLACGFSSSAAASADEYYAFNARFGAPLAPLMTFPRCKYQDRDCRRWGIAAELPVAARPQSSIDSEYVEILAAGGINFIRFNSIDSKRNKVFPAWYDKKFAQADALLKPLDELVSTFEKRDMQYALSANDGSYKAKFAGAANNQLPVDHRQYKASQLTHEPAIRLAEAWLKWIYGRSVKGRPNHYGADPGNRYITLVGEDSVYERFFRDRGRYLDANTRAQLVMCISGKPESLLNPLPDSRTLLRNAGLAEKTAGCLAAAEKNFYELLLTPGLKQVIPANKATSNYWYGLGYMDNSRSLGNVIDIHGYFDHVVYFREQGRKAVESVRNQSIIARPGLNAHGQKNLLRPNLLSLFAASVVDMPIYVSEWNHPFWSDYAYEGPLLMTAYASYQNYPLLTMHTLMAWNDDKTVPVSSHGFSVHGNQVLQVMNPVLALAYRRGDIAVAPRFNTVAFKGRSKSLHQEMFKVGLDPSYMSARPELGLVSGLRFSFADGAKSPSSQSKLKTTIATESKQVSWDFANPDQAKFRIDTERFQAVAGALQHGYQSDALQLTANTHGALLMISLDGLKLPQSRSILITVVSSQKNEGMKSALKNKRGFPYPLKTIVSSGKDNVLLRKIVAQVRLLAWQGKRYRLSSIDQNGTATVLNDLANDRQVMELTVGQANTPWYHLERLDAKN